MVVRVRVTLLLGRLNTLGVEALSDILVLRRSEVVQTDGDSLGIYKAVDGTSDFFIYPAFRKSTVPGCYESVYCPPSPTEAEER
jgi:hypothetical protein